MEFTPSPEFQRWLDAFAKLESAKQAVNEASQAVGLIASGSDGGSPARFAMSRIHSAYSDLVKCQEWFGKIQRPNRLKLAGGGN